MQVQGEESVISGVTGTDTLVERRFCQQFEGPGVEAAHDMLRHEPIDAILFGFTISGGMVAAIADPIDMFCLDAFVTPLHVAIAQVAVTQLTVDADSSLKTSGGR